MDSSSICCSVLLLRFVLEVEKKNNFFVKPNKKVLHLSVCACIGECMHPSLPFLQHLCLISWYYFYRQANIHLFCGVGEKKGIYLFCEYHRIKIQDKHVNTDVHKRGYREPRRTLHAQRIPQRKATKFSLLLLSLSISWEHKLTSNIWQLGVYTVCRTYKQKCIMNFRFFLR